MACFLRGGKFQKVPQCQCYNPRCLRKIPPTIEAEVKTNASDQVTDLLITWRNEDRQALEKLIPFVYKELHRLAHHYMRTERSDHSLQTTALVNELFLKLIAINRVQWKDRVHFFAVC